MDVINPIEDRIIINLKFLLLGFLFIWSRLIPIKIDSMIPINTDSHEEIIPTLV